MCRSIKQLRHAQVPATEQEIFEAARQYVRKVSGFRTPSKRNQEVFDRAILEITRATQKMLDGLAVPEAQTASPASSHTHAHPHA